MAAFNFPNSPSVNDIHTENGVSFKWNGTMWNRFGPAYTDTSNLYVTGLSTFVGNAQFDANVSIGGTLTYEDVKNVDSVGVVTARAGIVVSGGTLKLPTVPGTNTNGLFGVLYQTASGVIDGGSGLRYDPGGSELDANGLKLYASQVRGNGNDLHLTTQNNNGQCDIHLSNIQRFDTGGSERVRIQSTGVVNIGDTTASSLGSRLLQIGKTDRSETYVEIRNSTSGTGGFVWSDGTASDNTGYRGTIEYSHGNDAMYFKTAATERLRIVSDGKIGIGVAAPGELLHLKTASGNCKIRIDAAATPSLDFYEAGTRNSDIMVDYSSNDLIVTNRQNANITFRTNGANERLRITSGGQVNIGGNYTQTFNALDVTGNIKASARFNANDAVFIWQQNRMSLGNSFIIESQQNTPFAILTQGVAQPIVFGTNSTERLRITSGGQVQVKGTNSNDPLLVKGGTGGNASIRLEGGNNSDDNSRIEAKYSLSFAVNGDGNQSGRSFYFYNNTTEQLAINAAGQAWFPQTVGIQTNDVTRANLANPVGAGHSLVGMYIGDGSLLFNNTLNRTGGYYISTETNALNAGPVTLDANMKIDGAWVIV